MNFERINRAWLGSLLIERRANVKHNRHGKGNKRFYFPGSGSCHGMMVSFQFKIFEQKKPVVVSTTLSPSSPSTIAGSAPGF